MIVTRLYLGRAESSSVEDFITKTWTGANTQSLLPLWTESSHGCNLHQMLQSFSVFVKL